MSVINYRTHRLAFSAARLGFAAMMVLLVAAAAVAQEIGPRFQVPERPADSRLPAGPSYSQPEAVPPPTASSDDTRQPSYGLPYQPSTPGQSTTPGQPAVPGQPNAAGPPAGGTLAPGGAAPTLPGGAVSPPPTTPANGAAGTTVPESAAGDSLAPLLPQAEVPGGQPAPQGGYPDLREQMVEPAPDSQGPSAEAPSLQELRVQLRNTLQEREELVRAEFIAGRAYLADLLAATDEVLYADLQLLASPAERLSVLQEYVANLKDFEAKVEAAPQARRSHITPVDVLALRAIRIRAQIGLAQEQAAAGQAKYQQEFPGSRP